MSEKYISDHFYDPAPVETLEDKVAALEAKFAALEHKHEDLHQRTYRLTENETGRSPKLPWLRYASIAARAHLPDSITNDTWTNVS